MRYVSFLIAVSIALLLNSGCQEEKPQAQSSAPKAQAETTEQAKQNPAETMEHAKPEAGMKMAEEPNAGRVTAGQAIYEKNCSVCHSAGLAGAPVLGDKEAWGALNAKGIDQLVHVAINGEGDMPPRGGNPDLTDDEIRLAVSHMMEKGR